MITHISSAKKYVLEENPQDHQNAMAPPPDGVDIFVKGTTGVVKRFVPGASIATDYLPEAYETYQDGGDASDVALAVTGFSDVKNAVTNQESSWWEKSIDVFLGGVKWFFKTISFGLFGDAVDAASSGYKGAVNVARMSNLKQIFGADTDNLSRILNTIDRNHDKNLSHAEMVALDQVLDTNKDGKVTKEEVYALSKKLVMDKFDKNKDGKLSEEELNAVKDDYFDLDDDLDGKVTEAELQAFINSPNNILMEHIDEQHEEAFDKVTYDEDQAKSDLIRTLGRSSKKVVEDRWQELDRPHDNDTHVDRDEYQAALNRLDQDNDGVIFPKEIQDQAGGDANRLFDIMKAGGR